MSEQRFDLGNGHTISIDITDAERAWAEEQRRRHQVDVDRFNAWFDATYCG